MSSEVVLEIAKNIHSRSVDQSNEIIDKDLNEPIGSVPIMEMSDSDIADDEVNEENDGSSLGMQQFHIHNSKVNQSNWFLFSFLFFFRRRLII